jgi:hypothetical protein
VLLWRLSANMPALNDGRLPGFSATIGPLPPGVCFLTVFADLRVPADLGSYRQARALATVGALVVNVITI